MNNDVLLINNTPVQDTVLVPVTAVQADLVTQTDTVVYVPLASKTSHGVVKVGEGLIVSPSGVLSLDDSKISIKEISKNGVLIAPDENKRVNLIITKDDVGLNKVNNTSDDEKPISTAQRLALDSIITQVDTKTEALQQYIKDEVDRINDVLYGAEKATAYDTYEEMVVVLNNADNKLFFVGQSIYIGTQNVPDLWVYAVEDDKVLYGYTSDAALESQLQSDGTVKIGYYRLSQLESKKLDLSNYVTKDKEEIITGNKIFDKVSFVDSFTKNKTYLETYNGSLYAVIGNYAALRLDGVNKDGYVFDKQIATKEYADTNFISYSYPQVLTEAQKAQARENIGAGTGGGGTVEGSTVYDIDGNKIQTLYLVDTIDETTPNTLLKSSAINNLFVPRTEILKDYTKIAYTNSSYGYDLSVRNERPDNVGSSVAGISFLSYPSKIQNGLSSIDISTSSVSEDKTEINSAYVRAWSSGGLLIGSEFFEQKAGVHYYCADIATSNDKTNPNVQIKIEKGEEFPYKTILTADSTGVKVDGNLEITGDIVQKGAAYETHAEQVFSTNDYIVLRDGAISSLGDGYAGFLFKKYDGINDGRLVVDANGVARVGDVGDEQPLATREETPLNGGIAVWDDNTYKFISTNTITNEVSFLTTPKVNDVPLALSNNVVDLTSLQWIDGIKAFNQDTYLKDTSSNYSDNPETATHRSLIWQGINNKEIARVFTYVGNGYNSLNLQLRDKSFNAGVIEFAVDSAGWRFNPMQHNTMWLGANSKRWKRLYLSDKAEIAGVVYTNSGFTHRIAAIEKGKDPSATVWSQMGFTDKNGIKLGGLENGYSTTQNRMNMIVYPRKTDSTSTNAQISVFYDANDTVKTYAPTPPASDNSTQIATTAWVNTKTSGYLPASGGSITNNLAIGGSLDLTGKLNLASTSSNYPHITGDGCVWLSTNGAFDTTAGLYGFETSAFRPSNAKNNLQDLGGSGSKWRNLYLGGNISNGTNSVSVNNLITNTTFTTGYGTLNSNFIQNGVVTWVKAGRLVVVNISDMCLYKNKQMKHLDAYVTGLPKSKEQYVYNIFPWPAGTLGHNRVAMQANGTSLVNWYDDFTSSDVASYFGVFAYYTD